MVDLTHLDALIKQTEDNIKVVHSLPRSVKREETLWKLHTTKRSLNDVRELLLDPDLLSMPWGYEL